MCMCERPPAGAWEPETPPSQAVPKAQFFHIGAPLCLAAEAAAERSNMVIS